MYYNLLQTKKLDQKNESSLIYLTTLELLHDKIELIENVLNFKINLFESYF